MKPDSHEGYKLLSQINEAFGQNEMALKNYQKSLELKATESYIGRGDQNYPSPSKLKTTSNRSIIIGNPKNENGPNTSQVYFVVVE